METFIATKDKKLVKLCLESTENISYAEIMKLLRRKDIKVNGKRVNKDISVFAGDKIELYVVKKGESAARFSVIYEDENVIVIDKQSGVTSEEVFNSLQTAKNAAANSS